MNPTLTLIISTHDQPRQLARILERIATGSRQPEQILVAEDGENPDTAAVVAKFATRLPITHFRQPHVGFRKALILNRAIAAATGDYVVFLDGDCLPHRDFLRDHAALAERGRFTQGRRAFVHEKHVPALLDGKTSLLRLALTGGMHGLAKGIRLPYPKIKCDRDFHGVLGCNLAAWRDDLLAVNGYDEDFVGWGHEDSDLAARLYARGVSRRVVHGRAVVYHLDHPPAPRNQAQSNLERFRAGVASGRDRCDNGVVSARPAPGV